MLRSLLLATAGVALASSLAAPAPKARAAESDIAGNWILTSVAVTGESVVCILKVESKGGKPAASVVFSPPNVEASVTEFRATESGVNLTLKQVRTFKDQKTAKEQKFTSETTFVGVRGKDPKVIHGSTGSLRFRGRAKLTATDKQTLAKDELVIRADLPEPMTKVQQLNSKVAAAQIKVLREKDAEKKKELQKDLGEVRKEAEEQFPGLYRRTAEKHPDSPAAFDASISLLRMSGDLKLTAAEAARLVRLAQRHADPYGPLFSAATFVPVAETLAARPGLEAVAVAAIEPSVAAMADDHPTAVKAEVFGAYKFALEKAGRTNEARALAPRLARLENILDTLYLRDVPPFKPPAFAGRKDKSANRVAVMELFTGAQCPPCVAADVAFDALLKSYRSGELVLIQYHMHIPGPDELTNPDTVARWDYYREEFPDDIRGTPSTLFNGKPLAGGGGGMVNAQAKYKQYTDIINPLLEKTSAVKLAGTATRDGDRIAVAVDVAGADDADLKLRLLVVEESVKYVGGNGLRFHHQVVRAMPGGAEGVAVKGKSFKHAATADLGEVRKELNKYLDEYAAETRPFPKPQRPMDLTGLKVIVLVQDDKTKEIVQAAQFDVGAKPAATGGK
jgi:hypothetical protein